MGDDIHAGGVVREVRSQQIEPPWSAALVTVTGQLMTAPSYHLRGWETRVNHVQRQLRIISDHQVDDTSGELSARDRAAVALEITEAALADGLVNTTEALSILCEQRLSLAAWDLSIERNREVQREMDAAIAWLGSLPAEAISRLPAAPQLVTDAPLFRGNALRMAVA